MFFKILRLVLGACECQGRQRDERHRGADSTSRRAATTNSRGRYWSDKERLDANFAVQWSTMTGLEQNDAFWPRVHLQDVISIKSETWNKMGMVIEMLDRVTVDPDCLSNVKFTIMEMAPGDATINADEFLKQSLNIQFRQQPLHDLFDTQVEYTIFVKCNDVKPYAAFREDLKTLCKKAAEKNKYLSFVVFL